MLEKLEAPMVFVGKWLILLTGISVIDELTPGVFVGKWLILLG